MTRPWGRKKESDESSDNQQGGKVEKKKHIFAAQNNLFFRLLSLLFASSGQPVIRLGKCSFVLTIHEPNKMETTVVEDILLKNSSFIVMVYVTCCAEM